MADLSKRLATNVEGDFFVDSTCIDCDTCRQLAPATFVEKGEYSTVFQQPATDQETLAAYQALLSCPVGSIGTARQDPSVMAEARASFPIEIADGVFLRDSIPQNRSAPTATSSSIRRGIGWSIHPDFSMTWYKFSETKGESGISF
jgi:ferredoxin